MCHRALPSPWPIAVPHGRQVCQPGSPEASSLLWKERDLELLRNLTCGPELAAAPSSIPRQDGSSVAGVFRHFILGGRTQFCLHVEGCSAPQSLRAGFQEAGLFSKFSKSEVIAVLLPAKTPDVSSSQQPAPRFLNAWPHSFTHHSLLTHTHLSWPLQCVRHQAQDEQCVQR